MKNCLECRHSSLDWGDHGYSEYTPGWPGKLMCGRIGTSLHKDDQPSKVNVFEFAEGCEQYSPEDWVK